MNRCKEMERVRFGGGWEGVDDCREERCCDKRRIPQFSARSPASVIVDFRLCTSNAAQRSTSRLRSWLPEAKRPMFGACKILDEVMSGRFTVKASDVFPQST